MLATILQIVGLGLASLGVCLFYVPAGLIALGASAYFVGLQLERSK